MKGTRAMRLVVVVTVAAFAFAGTQAHAFTPMATVVTGGLGPTATAVDPSTGTAYTTNMYSGTVTAIDASNVPVAPVPAGGGAPRDAAFDFSTSTLFVAHFTGVSRFAAAGTLLTPLGTTPTASWTSGVAVNPLTNLVYAAMPAINTVAVINGITGLLVTTIPVPGFPHHLAVDFTTGTLYVGQYTSSSLAVIDLLTNTVMATIPICAAPRDVAVRWTTHRVYVACETTTSQVAVVTAGPPASVTLVTVKGIPRAIDVDQSTGFAQVGVTYSGTTGAVIQIDPSLAVSGVLSAGGFPAGVEINWANGRSYIAEFGYTTGTTVDVIQ